MSRALDTVFDALDVPTPVRKPPARKPRAQCTAPQRFAGVQEFYAHMPSHSYLYEPTRELWPAASVNGRISPWPLDNRGKAMRPTDWLDQYRAVEQMVWDPNEPVLINNRVMQVSGYATHDGASVFNLYRPPESKADTSTTPGPWQKHLRRLYPEDADHIERYLAFKVQKPGVKINHALVIGGAQGIGKDTFLTPVRQAIGAWNCQDVSPAQLMGRFNGFAKCVLLVISEVRDLGDVDRIAFYDHSKTYLAAPPDVIRVDEKNLREHYVLNVCGVVITTNHKTDGLYLPADDRRHYVAWSEATREEFDPMYWTALYEWYEAGGTRAVISHLMSLDLSGFDPKAPPTKTPAFWAAVQANEAPENGELRDVIDELQNPAVVTLDRLITAALALKLFDLADELKDRRTRRTIPRKLDRIGYVQVRNPDSSDGLFTIGGRRQTVYGSKKLPLNHQVKAARSFG